MEPNANDCDRHHQAQQNGSGGSHGQFFNPLLRMSSADTWAVARLRIKAERRGTFGQAAAPDLGNCCTSCKIVVIIHSDDNSVAR